MLNKIRNRIKKDDGNSSIILGLMLIMALMLVGGMLLDVSKAYQIKSSYVDAARKATQAAVMEQTTQGYLKPEAAGEAIRVYEYITKPSVITIYDESNDSVEGYFSQCHNRLAARHDMRFDVTFIDEDGNTETGWVWRRQVRSAVDSFAPGDTPAEAKKVRDRITQSLVNTGMDESRIRNGRFTEIQINMTEETENIILPGAFSITQSTDERARGINCQEMEIAAKGSVFTGSSDGDYR